ncbi:MAG: glycosyltransferase [Bdellovibrionales bacterium]|nr:glycosyltransferase [Bdellovibrionales bacterium]
MRAALNITTYNNPRVLALCLESLRNQSRLDFEIFISDDGSTEETRKLIDDFRARSGMVIHHHWHPDDGYKKSKINNVTFSKIDPVQFPVVICIDHDVICHRDFVSDHLAIHEKQAKNGQNRVIFMGRRIDLGPAVTAQLSVADIADFQSGVSWKLLKSWLSGDTRLIQRAVRVTSPLLIRLLGRDRVDDLLGSNFSISTQLLLEVNGYNEDYVAYWGEDGDLFVRVRNSGAVLIGLKGYAIQYHLDHKRLEPSKENQARYQDLLKDRTYVRCRNGIKKGA